MMNDTEISVLPYCCPRCRNGQAFPSIDLLRLHLQIHHHMEWKSKPSPTLNSMPYYLLDHPATQGLSPSAQELGQQIAHARQLLQKQRQAESRATSLLKDHPASRPSAHIIPRRKTLPLLDDDTGPGDASLAKSGMLVKHPHHLHMKEFSAAPRSHLEKRVSLQDSATKNVSDQASEERLLSKWKAQSEIWRLEARLQDKTREVADLRTKVDQTVRVAQEKERNIAEVKAFLQDTAVKQAAAKEKLRRYIDDLADRAERAESEVQDLRSSLSPPKTDTSTRYRSDSKSTSQATYPGAEVNQSATSEGIGQAHHVNTVNYSQISHALSHTDNIPLLMRSIPDNSFLSSALIPDEALALNSIPNDIDQRLASGSHSWQESPSSHHVPSGGHIPYRSDQRYSYSDTYARASLSGEQPIRADVAQSTHQTPERYDSTYPRVGKASPHPVGSRPGIVQSSSQSTSSYLLPASIPAHGNGNGNPGNRNGNPGNGNGNGNPKDPTDWADMDFLEDVVEDVLARRRERENREEDSPYLMPTPTGRLTDRPHSHVSSLGYGHAGHQGTDHYRGSHPDDDDDDSESASDVSVTSESQWSEEGRWELQTERGKTIGQMEWERRQAALFLVFSYLSTSDRLNCASVSREWRAIAREPALWQYVRLRGRRISSKFLRTISKWCSELKWLILERLLPRERREDEGHDVYQKKIRGSLEPGMEDLLRSAGSELLTIKIVDCPHIITERVLWLVSCYSRSLRSVTYVSSSDPLGPEVLWALGAGCRHIKSLKIPPRQPCARPERLSSSCVSMIGRCWPQLQALSVGGPRIKPESLALVAKSCPKLQVLELDHMIKITEERAIALCRGGLRGLHTLILKHTPITPSAVIHFNAACPQLTRVSVHLSVSDFFPSPASPGQRKEFSRAIETLMDLGRKRALEHVLQVRADYK